MLEVFVSIIIAILEKRLAFTLSTPSRLSSYSVVSNEKWTKCLFKITLTYSQP